MVEPRPKLIIVPGIGDDARIYYAFARHWNRLGYDTHVISFNWREAAVPFDTAMAAFLRQVDRFRDKPVYIIGISAGGTVAVNTLTVRNNVKKVITICSPWDTMPNLHNPLLAASIARLKANLLLLTPQQKQRLLSVYGLYDQVVATHLSRPAGVPSKRVLGIVHAPTIYLAVVLYTRSLHRFLKSVAR
jgi:alpha-beta hydrolase superfamily lysophospholipase